MSLAAFLESPWASSHDTYEKSAINIRPAPEFATAEVVVASTYRAVGFEGHAEGSVPTFGRELDKQSRRATGHGGQGSVGQDTWRTILHSVLESPKQPNQSSRRFLQLCPIVPDVALYSGSARLSGNSWNPGQLVERMVQFGASSPQEAAGLWESLFAGLGISEDDDVWARWLQLEFERRRLHRLATTINWQGNALGQDVPLPDAPRDQLHIPAVQFTRDVAAILRAKGCMTRRQWVSLLEAVLRIGAVAHVLWLCEVNDSLWRSVRRVLDTGEVPDEHAIPRIVLQGDKPHLVYGAPALPIIRDMASRYLGARLGLNLILWQLGESGDAIPSLSSVADIARFLRAVAKKREQLHEAGIMGSFSKIRDEQARVVACKRGIGSNMVEFCRYTLGQRQTADETLRGYDQGYQLRKRAEYASAPWVVSLGPVALLALVHCCLEEAAGPRSIQRLSEHLAWYGIEVDRDDIAKSDLGRKLRMLGLVLDSPDAESGMLLVPPFDQGVASSGGDVQ